MIKFNPQIPKKIMFSILIATLAMTSFIEGCGGWTYAYDRDPRARIIYRVQDDAKLEFWETITNTSKREGFKVTLQSSTSSYGEHKTLWGRKLEVWVTGSIFPDSNQVIVTMYASKIQFFKPEELDFSEFVKTFSSSLNEIKSVEQLSFEILEPNR